MSATGTVGVPRLGSTGYSAARMRVVTAALELFGSHGVSGTSLQMIADAVGVTKAAVYHQFKTKEAIVVAAVDVELGTLEGALEAAETPGAGHDALELLLGRVIDVAVGRRRMVGNILYDPVIVRLLAEHVPFQQFMERLFRAAARWAHRRRCSPAASPWPHRPSVAPSPTLSSRTSTTPRSRPGYSNSRSASWTWNPERAPDLRLYAGLTLPTARNHSSVVASPSSSEMGL